MERNLDEIVRVCDDRETRGVSFNPESSCQTFEFPKFC